MKLKEIAIVLNCLKENLALTVKDIEYYQEIGEIGCSADENGEHYTADTDRAFKALEKRNKLIEAIRIINEEDW